MKRGAIQITLVAFLCQLLLLLSRCNIAWAVDNTWVGPNDGNWNTAPNWTAGFAPDANFSEAALINNNTTAILSQHAQSDFVDVNVGGLKLGTTAGSGGGLRITSGGNLPNVIAGNETGAIAVGVVGQGNLTVLGGGTISGTSLSLGGAAGSSITLGDSGALTANLTVSGAADLQRTTTIIGPNVNFNAGGNLTLGGSSTLIAEIRSATAHSPLRSGGTASVAGTFKPIFTGVIPALGNRWTLIDAATALNGTFTNLDFSMAPPPSAGQAYQIIQGTTGTRHLLELVLSASEKTWAVDADGTFSVGANWTGGVAPAGAGDFASFGNIITANRTVTVTNRVTVGTLKFNDNNNYTLAGGAGITLEVTGAGNAEITVQNTNGNGAHTINSPLIVADSLVITQDSTQPLTIGGGFNVSGQSVTKAGSGTVIVPRVRAASLSVNTGAVVITPDGNSLGTSELNSLTVGGTTKLDLNNNDLVVHATAATKDAVHAAAQADIVSAQNGLDANFITNWDGPGITSSFARTSNVATGFDLTGLGVIRNSDIDIITGLPGESYTTFSGRPVTPDDILVKYTYIGDGNLDGLVGFDDYVGMDNAFFGLIPNLGWATGDINFDGVINFDDYSVVDQAFFFQGAPLARTDVAGVPEPGTEMLLIVFGLAVLLTRARR